MAATSGYNVTLVEVSSSLAEQAQNNIKKSLQRVAKKQYKDNEAEQTKFVAETVKRISGSSDLQQTVKQTDLVIEAIVENIKVKHALFSSIDSVSCSIYLYFLFKAQSLKFFLFWLIQSNHPPHFQVAPSHTIFTSNTSSLSISEIASVTNRKDRFGGLHFFNPVPVMRLLEVIRTPETSDDTYNKIRSFGESVGKTCISCKDTPGFVVNRLLVPYLGEAVRLLERGDASARDIDIAMKLGAGHPMGPIELADYVGLDTTNSILNGWHEKFPDHPLFKPLPILEKLVKEGKLGVKSGEGFYKYTK